MLKYSGTLLLATILLYSGFCHADTIYLKNGKVIQSSNIWKEDGHFMYTMYGATIGIAEDKVDRVEYDAQAENADSGFQFDVWPFGCTVHQAINIAESNDIPLHKDGIISVNKRFHPMVRKYSDATHFYYKAKLLGHHAKVNLFFTPVSKQLHNIQIQWFNQRTRDSVLAREIFSMISGKYGEPLGSGRQFFHDTTKWVIGGANQIEMKVHSSSIQLSYLHAGLGQLYKNETRSLQAQKVQLGSTKDKSKF